MEEKRRFALIALAVLAAEKIGAFMIFKFLSRSHSMIEISLTILGLVFYWIVPLLVVYVVERGYRLSLGLVIGEGRFLRYGLYAFIGLILPGFIIGFNQELILSLMEQILLIGLAEEVLWRGYLQSRLCEWLGVLRGLLLTSFLFGSGHLVSLFSQHGFEYLANDLLIFSQTFIGGMILGYIFIRAKSVIPGAIFHIFGNLYLFQLVGMLSG